jgi:hypothetical protein
MSEMSDSFVDLSYRGLPLARRVKLTQLGPTAGFVEMPAPMPVGTRVAIATDDGVQIDAVVAEIHEQVAGASATPGMRLHPTLEGAGATWWNARAVTPDSEPARSPPSDTLVPTTIVGRSHKPTTPDLADDGRSTAVMDAVEPEAAAPEPVEDDGKRTTMMDAVDLAALGLDPATRPSGDIATPPKYDDDPETRSSARKKRRRR